MKRFYESLGLSKKDYNRLTNIRNGIIDRCERKYSTRYCVYGKTGIKVCDEWRRKNEGKRNFFIWAVNNGYKDGLTVDRIDNSKGYYPENCRWATYEEQANNRKNNVLVDYKGKKMTMKEIAKDLGISVVAVFYKVKNNKKIEKTERGEHIRMGRGLKNS